jgi:hypothetical protein
MSFKHKIKVFHALLADVGIRDQKEAILEGYGVTSTTDLTQEQIDHAIAKLREMQDSKKKAPRTIRQKRSSVLDLLTQLGVYVPGNNPWPRVNRYLKNPRIAGKLLYEMNETELDALVKKLHAIKIKLDKKLEEDKWWATHN